MIKSAKKSESGWGAAPVCGVCGGVLGVIRKGCEGFGGVRLRVYGC